jgi:hypothetical protein
MSFVQGQGWARPIKLHAWFAAAFVASSFAIFGVAGFLGTAAKTAMPLKAQAILSLGVLACALILDIYSLKQKSWCVLSLRRQTPKSILRDYGARRAALAWGLDAGLVFTTFRMSSLSWALLALAIIGVAPSWVGLGYAAGFLLPFLLASVLSGTWPATRAPALAERLARSPSVARATCVVALACSVVMSLLLV